MKMIYSKFFSMATTAVIAVCFVFVFTPLPSTHADSPNAPDGSHTIAQIFPDPAVAQDIADQIASSNTGYIPQSAADFNMVTTLSLPYYDVASLEGIQYCLKLKYLYVPGNKLKNSDISVVSSLPLLTHINISSGADITSDVFGILKNLPLIRLAANWTAVSDSGIETLPTSISVLEFSYTNIGDAGAEKIAGRFAGLTRLYLENANISDAGAAKIAATTNATAMELKLAKNHIGTAGITSLSSLGFSSLDMDAQTIEAAEISDGYAPAVHSVIIDTAYLDSDSISDGGVFDSANGTITWPALRESNTYTYSFSCMGFSGTVSVPFRYVPFVYSVTFMDREEIFSVTEADDMTILKDPKEPVREGFVFTGWSLSEDGNETYDFSSNPITGDLTLYAGWTKNLDDTGETDETSEDIEEDAEEDADEAEDVDKAEDVDQPKDTESSDEPQTADSFAYAFWICLLVVSAVGTWILWVARRRMARK